jgi:hypothetical protein
MSDYAVMATHCVVASLAAQAFQHSRVRQSSAKILFIALSCRGARYRELMLFVRIWKGLRNIAEQNLLCITYVVRTGKFDY